MLEDQYIDLSRTRDLNNACSRECEIAKGRNLPCDHDWISGMYIRTKKYITGEHLGEQMGRPNETCLETQI